MADVAHGTELRADGSDLGPPVVVRGEMHPEKHYLSRFLSYDPATGEFRWLAGPRGGEIAG